MSKIRGFKTAKFLSAPATQDEVKLKEPMNPPNTPEMKTPSSGATPIPSPPRKRRVTIMPQLDPIVKALDGIVVCMEQQDEKLNSLKDLLTTINARVESLFTIEVQDVSSGDETDDALPPDSQQVKTGGWRKEIGPHGAELLVAEDEGCMVKLVPPPEEKQKRKNSLPKKNTFLQ